jgi:hypothetical protein
MNRETALEALRATARVACAATLLSCKPTVEPAVAVAPDVAVNPGTELGWSLTSADSPFSTDNPNAWEENLAYGAEVGTTGKTHAECWTHVAESLNHDGAIADDDAACCDQLTEGMFMGDPVQQACCSQIGWDPQGSPACTPWGPPRPPAMAKLTRGAAEAGAQAVRLAAA